MEFLTNCIFFGTEVEGPFRGTPTLFVAKPKVTREELQAAIKEAESRGIQRIYFGAGKTHQFPLFVLAENDGPTDLLAMLPQSWQWVLEINPSNLIGVKAALDDPAGMLEMFRVVLDLSEFPDFVSDVKCEMHGNVYWWGLTGKIAVITKLNDPMYSEDTEYVGAQTS